MHVHLVTVTPDAPAEMPAPGVAGVLLSLVASGSAIRLTTSVSLPSSSVTVTHAFLATPANWPDFVLSSSSVEGEGVDQPFGPGQTVDEVFGLPPVLPLAVSWECVASR